MTIKSLLHDLLPNQYQIVESGQVSSLKDILVVLHLFYPEMWEYFEARLRQIGDFDLIITTPLHNQGKLGDQLVKRPNTKIVYTTNRGRDILPFIEAIRLVDVLRYKAILKLHTKKSPHFEGGQTWMDSMVESLTNISISRVIEVFEKHETVIGPKGQYMSLEVNFEANGQMLERILIGTGVPRGTVLSYTQQDRANYGFFAGSMVWISPKYVASKMFKHPIQYFETEKGQVDGTYAHALERALTLKLEIMNRPIYETDGKVLSEVGYDKGFIPEWSDKYVGRT